MEDETGTISDAASESEPKGVVDDVIKGCFGSLLIFGFYSTGALVIIIFAIKILSP